MTTCRSCHLLIGCVFKMYLSSHLFEAGSWKVSQVGLELPAAQAGLNSRGLGLQACAITLSHFFSLLESWEKRLVDPSPCSPLSLLQYFHTFLGCLWPQSKESLSLLFTFNYLLVSESHKVAFYVEASVRPQKWISHQSCQHYERGDSSKMSVTNRYFKGDQYRKLTLLHNLLLISKG